MTIQIRTTQIPTIQIKKKNLKDFIISISNISFKKNTYLDLIFYF